MKKRNCIIVISLLVILLSALCPSAAFANAAEPPSFTVIVSNPPDDLSLSLQFTDGTQTAPILLNKEQKGWEAYYRFFYDMRPQGNESFEGAVLMVQSSENSFQCSLPAGSFDTYNNLLTLDMSKQNITAGQSVLRVPLLVAMRVACTLLIEGFIFFLFGYRRRQSWLAFFAINIITQGGLNAMLTGPGTGSYWMLGLLLGEILVLLAEMIAFSWVVKECKRGRTLLYVAIANAASLVAGGLLIAYLPV